MSKVNPAETMVLIKKLEPLVSEHLETDSLATVGLALAVIMAEIALKVNGKSENQRLFIKETCKLCIKIYEEAIKLKTTNH